MRCLLELLTDHGAGTLITRDRSRSAGDGFGSIQRDPDRPQHGVCGDRPAVRRPRADPLRHVDTWVFDLDNTLYPAATATSGRRSTRASPTISPTCMGLDGLSARALQKYYYRRSRHDAARAHGRPHAIDPAAFLAFVHDIDRTRRCRPNPPPRRGHRGAARPQADPHQRVARPRLEDRRAARHRRWRSRMCSTSSLPISCRSRIRPPTTASSPGMTVDPRRAAMFEDIARNLVDTARPRHGHDPGRSRRRNRPRIIASHGSRWA